MNSRARKLLEFDKIIERLEEYVLSSRVRDNVRNLMPSTDIRTIEVWQKETTEARAILNISSSPPVFCLDQGEKAMEMLEKECILQGSDLEGILKILTGGARIKRFMSAKSDAAPDISSYAYSIFELDDLAGEIERCITKGCVDDKAAPELAKVRKKIALLEDRIKSKLDSIMKSPAFKEYIQDGAVSIRNDRYVIPVKREHKRNFDGDVLDMSSSGSTVFIEPAGVKKLREELSIARIEEEKEVFKVLSYLTGLTENYKKEIGINIETIAHYEFLFAKGRLSKAMDGSRANMNQQGAVDMIQARHPLLGQSAVPLDFNIGRDYRTLVITGPNTGGKTVALKTVGLLTMMAQAGLHVPMDEDSQLSVFTDILVDIGDGQSIEQSLSTFSSHVRNIVDILDKAGPDTMVILDEIGTGTDPSEGMGLAIAVLEELYNRGATTIATTHYSEIKTYAEKKQGFKNARMEFDINTLMPLYRLTIGKPGESNAFHISLRLGMDNLIIERAHELTYGEKKQYMRVLPEAESIKINLKENKNYSLRKERTQKIDDPAGESREKKAELTFKIGDCVYISTMDRRGIVCDTENNKGDVGVMVMKNKFKINKKRLSLYIDSKEMYPDDYDFDIIFESKENRKKRHKMGKRHIEGMVIETKNNL